MLARDIMTPEPEVVTPHESVSLAAKIMDRLGISVLPVVHDRESLRLIGLITSRDIALRHTARRHGADCPVSAHMTRGNIDVVHPDAMIRDVVGRMKRSGVRHIPVIAEQHRIVGIISLKDVAEQGDALSGDVADVLRHVRERQRRTSPV